MKITFIKKPTASMDSQEIQISCDEIEITKITEEYMAFLRAIGFSEFIIKKIFRELSEVEDLSE